VKTFDQPFKVLISMSMFILLQIVRVGSILTLKENNVFSNSLLDATIYNGGMREKTLILFVVIT